MQNNFVIDELDRRILEQLQTDCSITNYELAQRVHASAPTCLRRVRRLRESGIIEKQVAIINPQRLGNTLTTIVEVTLDIQTTENMQAFERRAVAEPAILQCYRVSQGPDFILVAQVADMPAYHEMAHRTFTSDANVRNVRTFFSIHRSKFDTHTPITRNDT